MTVPTPVAIFEELRFVWELMAAEYLFLLPFARRKPRWLRRTLAGVVLFSVLSQFYFPWQGFCQGVLPLSMADLFTGLWYVPLALATMLYSRVCFQITVCDALYIGISGYAAQHLVYVTVHELLALDWYPQLTACLPLYALVSLAACGLLYSLLYRVMARPLSLCGGELNQDTTAHILHYVLLLAVLIFCTLSCQHLFHFDPAIRILSAQLGFLICAMILGIQYLSCRNILAQREQAVIHQMLRDGERHYTHSKELIEMVNRSVHDLKHTCQALRTMDESERLAFVSELEQNVAMYRRLVHADNEAVNTILVEKTLSCEKEGIRLACSLGHLELDFLSLPDLYTLLGNAIDNAVEGVRNLPDPEKRVVQLSIQTSGGFVSIQTNNYYAGELTLENGLPRTTKRDPAGHGYGLKSIRYLARKYGGSMSVSARDGVFVLQIMLPVQS